MSLRPWLGLVPAWALLVTTHQLVVPGLAHAQDDTVVPHELLELSLDEALALAEERAPRVEAARARIAQAEALRTQAALPLRDNPVLDLEAGPRFGGDIDGAGAVLGVGWSQSFELGGQRVARIAAAEAAAARASTEAELTARELQVAVGVAFLEAVATRQRLHVAEASLELTVAIVAAEGRRLEAGDASELEHAIALLALERAQAEVELVAAEHVLALAELRSLLGLDGDVALSVEGTLEDHLPRPDAQALLAHVADRPELRALEAEITEANALEQLAGSMAWPDLAVRVGYEFEDSAHAVLGSIAFTLPIFDSGQGTLATAKAQASAARVEAEVVERVAITRTEALLGVYEQLLEAITEYETQALELVERIESMARTAYEAGAVPLAELLTLRRELVAARNTHVDLLLNAVLVAFELRVAAGDLP